MSQPSEQEIQRIKAQLPERALRLVEFSNEDGELAFVMSGPSKPEYQKFQDEVAAALDKKSEKEKSEAVRAATERAALAQIRWPDRATAQAEIEKRPAMVLKFADLLQDMAGDSFEVRSKKL